MKIVNTIIFNKNKELLLCKKRDYWILPGGKIKKDEKIFIALRRELKEEINITKPCIDLLSEKIFNNLETIHGDNIEYVYVFKVSINENPIAGHEIEEINYFSKDKLVKLNLSNATRKILSDLEII